MCMSDVCISVGTITARVQDGAIKKMFLPEKILFFCVFHKNWECEIEFLIVFALHSRKLIEIEKLVFFAILFCI